MNSVDLHGLFMGLQKQLCAKLETDRQCIPHPGTKGDASELNWLSMLRGYLPARYAVEKAFVLDADGNMSDQIDIVVFDRQYHPLLFNQDGAIYVPAESVYAVFEVKQDVSKQTIQYAAGKAASVRQLRRTSVPIPHAGGLYAPKPLTPMLAGLLTLDSNWTAPIELALVEALRELPESGRLDLGCALRHCAFEVLTSVDGSVLVERSEEKTALVSFFTRLLKRLQELGTVSAMDIGAYGKAV